MDGQQFYFQQDLILLFDIFRNEISYLKNSWSGLGRPTVLITISNSVLGRWIQHFTGCKILSQKQILIINKGYPKKMQAPVVDVRNITEISWEVSKIDEWYW